MFTEQAGMLLTRPGKSKTEVEAEAEARWVTKSCEADDVKPVTTDMSVSSVFDRCKSYCIVAEVH